VIRADGQTKLLPNQHPPLGVLQDVSYVQDVYPITGGDALFLCSDGLADAILPNGERIGRELINTAVRQLVLEHHVPGAALHMLRRTLLHDEVKINDDVSLILVMLPSGSSRKERCELVIDMKSLRAFREFVAQQALHEGMSEADSAMFELASVEVFTNIVRHAKGLLAGAPVELIASCIRQEFVLEVIYLGEAYAPPEELTETNFDVFPEGGFGLTIIRSACDRVDYLHHEGVNTVRMCRYVET
jgi:anti-sigma regulatory factor (Ser/Thr protein kinase)